MNDRTFACALLLITACGAEPPSTANAPTDRSGSTAPDAGTVFTDAEALSLDARDGVAAADGGGDALSFETHIEPIITARCTGRCHPGGYAPMSLGPTDAYDNLVGAQSVLCAPGSMRVAPGDADNSELVAKITGIGMCGGNPMPPGGAPLDPADIDLIRRWIQAGANR